MLMKNFVVRTIGTGLVTLSLVTIMPSQAGNDDTVDYADIESPWVHFFGDNVDWTEYDQRTVTFSGVDYPFFTKVKGEGVDNIADWVSGSFFENATNRRRYVEHYVNDFDLATFNSYVGTNWRESNVNTAQIMLYNDASFTLNRTAVWIEKKSGDGVKEMKVFDSGTDVVEEELREVMTLLRPSVLRIRIGYKAKGELDMFGGDNWKKCAWVDVANITGAVFKARGALYDKKCSVEYTESSSY